MNARRIRLERLEAMSSRDDERTLGDWLREAMPGAERFEGELASLGLSIMLGAVEIAGTDQATAFRAAELGIRDRARPYSGESKARGRSITTVATGTLRSTASPSMTYSSERRPPSGVDFWSGTPDQVPSRPGSGTLDVLYFCEAGGFRSGQIGAQRGPAG